MDSLRSLWGLGVETQSCIQLVVGIMKENGISLQRCVVELRCLILLSEIV